MNRKLLAVVLGVLLAVPFSGSLGFAKGRSGKSETKLQAKLLPPLGVTIEDFDGKVTYKKKTDKKGTEEEIDAKVESELPNVAVGDCRREFGGRHDIPAEDLPGSDDDGKGKLHSRD